MKTLNSDNKSRHISSEYLINSRVKRLRLLAGIINANEYTQQGNYQIRQKHNQLRNQIVFLCRSLGIETKIVKSCESINFSMNSSLIDDIREILSQKVPILPTKKYHIHYDIEIRKIGVDTYYGFTIGKNHRFLLKDLTVTHNTLEMVALILRDKMEWDLSTPYVETTYSTYAGGRRLIKTFKTFEKLYSSLIVVNHSIIKQWEKEFTYTNLDVVSVVSNKDIACVDPACYDVVIVTCTMYNKLVNRFKDYAWKRFIFDEPGHVKITTMKRVHAGFTWLISATPALIYYMYKSRRNNMMIDLISGYHNYPTPDFFYNIEVRIDQEFIDQSFSMPETKHKYYKCYDPLSKVVNGLVNPVIIQMISSGNIKEAISFLGGTETDNIVDLIRLDKEQNIISIKQKLETHTKHGNTEKIKKYEEKLENVHLQISELDKRVNILLSEDCPICCSQILNPILETKCHNVFCCSCLFEWLTNHKTCPICRQDINTATLIHIKDSTKNETSDLVNSTKNKDIPLTKLQQIEIIIDENVDSKIIIFSSYDITFSIIRNFLKDRDITFSEIKGGIGKRTGDIQRFKDGDTKVLFLNSCGSGSGINLQEATDIILFHEMDEDVVKQVIGRANRIGRTNSLNVHYLLGV